MDVWAWNVSCIHSCSVSLSVSLYGGVCNNPGSRELEIKGETLVFSSKQAMEALRI